MTSPVDRITAVLRDAPEADGWFNPWRSRAEIAAHVAERVAAELQLTQMVNNADELAALPQFSVVQFRGPALGESHRVVWQLDGAWFGAGGSEFMHSGEFPGEAYPAVVLWSPSAWSAVEGEML